MRELMRDWGQANKENQENRRRALHNYDCETSELQPYDNSAYLELVSIMLARLKKVSIISRKK